MVSDRSRALNKRMDDLFQPPKRVHFTCWDCGWSTDLQWSPLAPLMYEQCPECGTELGREHVRVTDRNICRVCGEDASERRTRYCSERCSNIASAVQRMFTWSSVRERILERDGWTCGACGADVSEDADADPEVDHIQPISEDGHPLDERNLITLCGDCHDRKTHDGESLALDADAPDGLGFGEYLET